jgi:ribosomal protein S18 acetylase RimI-like enzyme
MPLSCSPLALTTRAATVTDIPLLRDLAERTWRVSYAEMIPEEQIDFMLGGMYGPEQIAKELREGVFWELAFAEDQPVGFFSVTFEESSRAKLNKLYILPERQGASLGRALLERVHELSSLRGVQEVWLQVNKQNARAIRAYQRAGYVIERSAVFEIGNGFVMDDFIMHRALASPCLNERATNRVSV